MPDVPEDLLHTQTSSGMEFTCVSYGERPSIFVGSNNGECKPIYLVGAVHCSMYDFVEGVLFNVLLLLSAGSIIPCG